MRNIIEYPITKQEVLDVLATYKKLELASDAVGGIEAAALQLAIDILSDIDF